MNVYHSQLWICLVWCVAMTVCELTHEQALCRSDADCGATECCVGLDKKRFLFNHPTSGTCQPLRYQGHACHVFLQMDPSNHNLHVHYCPCEKGLECRGTSIDKQNTTQVVHHNPKCLPINS